MIAQGGKLFFQTLSIVVLARLLSPDDFGLFGMVFAVAAFALVFKDLGLSTATIQRDEISHEQVSALFWINTLIGVAIGLLVALSAPLLTWFYGDPRVLHVTLVMAFAFPFGGLTVQHQALLRRQMRFGRLAQVQLASSALSMLTGVCLAWMGWKYWALVWMKVSGTMYTALGVWIACQWRPRGISRHVKLRPLLGFGAGITGFNVLNYFSRNTDKMIIGKFCGGAELGLYTTAYKLLLFPINQIRVPLLSVGIPALSALQNEPDRYRNYYRKMLFLVSFFSMPLVMFLLCCTEEIVQILLGSQWRGAVGIFRVMGILAFIQPVATCARGPVMLSMGFGSRYFRYGLILAIFTVIAFFIGIPWGAMGVIIAYSVSFYLLLIILLPWCLRDTPVVAQTFWQSIITPSIAAIAMGIGMLAIRLALLSVLELDSGRISHCFILCILVGCLGGIIFLVCMSFFPNVRRDLLQLWRDVRQGIYRKKSCEQ